MKRNKDKTLTELLLDVQNILNECDNSLLEALKDIKETLDVWPSSMKNSINFDSYGTSTISNSKAANYLNTLLEENKTKKTIGQ